MGEVWGGVSPPKSGGRVWGYNIKLISIRSTTTQFQKHPREKVGVDTCGVDVSTSVQPVAMPLTVELKLSYING